MTGLPASGKSTLAAALQEIMRTRCHRVEVLDGDVMRQCLSPELGFSPEDRKINIQRIAQVSHLLSRNGIAVIVAAIVPYGKMRESARVIHEARFIEVFVDCDLRVLISRDPKGLYAKALRGEIEQFSGVSDSYEPPENPEIHLHTDRQSVSESCEQIIAWLEASDLLPTRPFGAQT
jgi:adenylyl-sulfate kinase